MIKRCFISILGIVLCIHISAQNTYRPDNQEILFFEALFHLDIKQAKDILEDIEPLDQTAYLIGSVQLQWWDAISSGKSLNSLLHYIDSTERTFSKIPVYLEMHFTSMRLRVHTAEKNYLRAWREWKTFESFVINNSELFDKETSTFINGIYHCMKSEQKKRFPLLTKDSTSYIDHLIKGTGLLEESTHAQNEVISFEAHYFLMRVYSDMQSSCLQSVNHSRALLEKFPENYIFRYYHCNYLNTIGENENASKTIRDGLEALNTDYLNDQQKSYGSELLHSAEN